MVKKLTFCLLAILLLGGCGAKANLPKIELSSNRQDFKFPVGTEFQVVLPSNQTTGFEWQVNDITAGVLEQVSNIYKISDKYNNVVGAGGEEIWTFRVLQVERSHIVMKYLRPWDKLEVANEFLVTINGNPGDDGLATYLGKISSNTGDAKIDDCFVTEDGDKFGIVPVTKGKIEDPGVKAKVAEFINKNILVEIRGTMVDPAGDCNSKQLIVSEIQAK